MEAQKSNAPRRKRGAGGGFASGAKIQNSYENHNIEINSRQAPFVCDKTLAWNHMVRWLQLTRPGLVHEHQLYSALPLAIVEDTLYVAPRSPHSIEWMNRFAAATSHPLATAAAAAGLPGLRVEFVSEAPSV